MSGVTRDCSFSKWLCNVSRMDWGCEVICPVDGSVMVDSFGWSFAFGCNPASVFRLWCYRLGLFLYSASSFFLMESMGFLLALLRILVMALVQSVGISGIVGGLSNLRTSEAINGRVVSAVGGVVFVGWDLLARWWLFVRFLMRVMRFICLLSELLTGVCILVCCGTTGGWVIGHMDWTRLWYCV